MMTNNFQLEAHQIFQEVEAPKNVGGTTPEPALVATAINTPATVENLSAAPDRASVHPHALP